MSFKELQGGAVEMASWVRALAALAEDLGSIPNVYMTAHKCL